MLHDSDLLAIQEARDLVRRSAEAHQRFKEFRQDQVDRICEAVVAAARDHALRLGRMAVEESGFGDAESKARKTIFATAGVWESIRDMPTVGVIRRDDERRVYEIAEPFGVVVGIVPITNPTSTALFKILIALKTRNTILISPHPRGVRCIGESCRVAAEAARRAGAPADVILCLSKPTMDATGEAMRHRQTALILATGGPGLVRAAYGAGKPAIGVGPGNCPAYIEQSADVEQAVEAIVQSQVFDNSTICSSEQSVIVDQVIRQPVLDAFRARGGHFCSEGEAAALRRMVVRGRGLNPAIVGLYAHQLASMAGFKVPPSTTVLLAEEHGVGWDHPLSIEKLCPILAFYTVRDWKEGCQRCIEILDLGGRGHTLVIHSENQEAIWEFALQKPTHRILVNCPGAQGAVGFATHLRPSMTLGCGAFGGNITSDNISAEHLLVVKRLAWGKPGFVTEEAERRKRQGGAGTLRRTSPPTGFSGSSPAFRPWPSPPRKK